MSKNVPPPFTPRTPRSRMLPPSPPKEDDHHDDDSDLHRFIANVKVVRQHSSLFKLPQQSPVPSTLGAIEEPAEVAHEAASAASAEGSLVLRQAARAIIINTKHCMHACTRMYIYVYDFKISRKFRAFGLSTKSVL